MSGENYLQTFSVGSLQKIFHHSLGSYWMKAIFDFFDQDQRFVLARFNLGYHLND